MTRVLIGLGSNISPEVNLREAGFLLKKKFPVTRFSSVYRTAPVGYADQVDFLNAVALVETSDSPETIIKSLQLIERVMKKETPFRYGPRTIDLDFLLYGSSSIQEPDLVIPHPNMHERRFVLEPLLELIDASELHPKLQKSWRELLEATKDQRSEKVRFSII